MTRAKGTEFGTIITLTLFFTSFACCVCSISQFDLKWPSSQAKVTQAEDYDTPIGRDFLHTHDGGGCLCPMSCWRERQHFVLPLLVSRLSVIKWGWKVLHVTCLQLSDVTWSGMLCFDWLTQFDCACLNHD